MKIEKINYFKELEDNPNWNAKVIYRKYGKFYHALCYVDTFNKNIYLSANQEKECKVLAGLEGLLTGYDHGLINVVR